MRKVALCLFLIACLGTSSCANMQSEYVAAPTKGWVIDKDTKLPVEGVVVVAHWLLEGGNHYARKTTLMAAEAVTDKNGYYEIAGWGPLKNPGMDALWDSDPMLFVFKRGYARGAFENSQLGVKPASRYDPLTKQDVRKGRERYSNWDGKTLEIEKLKPFSGWDGRPVPMQDKILSEVTRLESMLVSIIEPYDKDSRNCYWTNLPRAFAEVHMAKVQLMADLGKSPADRRLENYTTAISRLQEPSTRQHDLGCPSPKEYFKQYLGDEISNG